MKLNIRGVNRICAVYLLCWTFVPPIQVGIIYRILAIVCVTIWFLTAIIVNTSFIQKNSNLFLLCIVTTAAIVGLRALVMPLSDAIIRSLQWILVCMIGLMFAYYRDSDIEALPRLTTIILLFVAIFSVTTITGDISNPYASRIANSEWLDSRFDGNENVGTYGFIYMCVFIEPCLLYYIKRKIRSNTILDIIVIIDSALIIALVFVSGYSIAVFCLLVSMFGVFIWKEGSAARNLFSLFVLIIVLAFYKQVMLMVIGLISYLFPNNIVWSTKMEEFRLLLTISQQSGDLAERTSNYMGSIRNIVNNPVVGCYLLGKNPSGGGHSFILDSIGNFGIIISFLMFDLMLMHPHRLIKNKNELRLWVGIIWCIFLILNPYTQEMAVSLFFIYPFIQLIDKLKLPAMLGRME